MSILAPRHVALKLGVVSGDALISGFTTDAKLSTVSGDIVLDNHEGDVELSSVSGEMSAGNHTGRITAHSVSGDVVATGDVRAFNADTVSGNMILDVYGTPDRVDTNTVSGDLTVRFDAGSGARYRINTVGGTVLLDDTTIRGMLGKGFERVTGELAGRWLDLGANSVSGSISVMRREIRRTGERMPRPRPRRQSAAAGTAPTRHPHDPAGLRPRQSAPLPARAARRAAATRLRADPGAVATGSAAPTARAPARSTRASSKLEEEGLVSKSADGRKTVYEITDAGRAELDARRTSSTASRTRSPTRCAVSPTACGPRSTTRCARLRAELASAAREAKRGSTKTSAWPRAPPVGPATSWRDDAPRRDEPGRARGGPRAHRVPPAVAHRPAHAGPSRTRVPRDRSPCCGRASRRCAPTCSRRSATAEIRPRRSGSACQRSVLRWKAWQTCDCCPGPTTTSRHCSAAIRPR